MIRKAVAQPVTVVVCVLLVVLAGVVSVRRIPVQLTPNVDDTVIAVTTFWEGASPDEIEREIVERQEEKLQGLTNLRSMTSESQQSQGRIRLEFAVGTPKEVALREVSDKLREVSRYPQNAEEPVVQATDPDNRDYIAWIIFSTTDPTLDIRTLQDFAEDNIKPVLERVEGVSEVNVLGGRERETQVRFDAVRLAQHGVTPAELVAALEGTNRNVSAGEVYDAKSSVRVRTVSQYTTAREVEETVIAQTPAGPVRVRDVAEVVETYKKPLRFVRSRGEPVIAINAQREPGSNVMQVMAGVRAAIDRLNASGGTLDAKARSMGLDGTLRLRQVYDQTIYIEQALSLVRSNLWLGGSLAVLVLLLFLRSPRPVLIVALAIPISVIGAVVAMVALGRSLNVVSLAGMAFATGMVVDNAIVVIENIYRHLEMGKSPMRAAVDGAQEVWGAVLAATLTTIFVFVPVLLIREEAGQLFRDISLAICAAVGLSLLVSVSVIPTAAARALRPVRAREAKARPKPAGRVRRAWRAVVAVVRGTGAALHAIPDLIGRMTHALLGSVVARVLVVVGLTAASIVGSLALMPPADYLPTGNRNLVFGLLIPPPGYNLEQQDRLADRIESVVRPYWEASGTDERARALRAKLQPVPVFDWARGGPGDPIVPPTLGNYFLVSFDGIMFHVGIADDDRRVVDLIPLFQHATRQEALPGVFAFAFQVPLFRLGGSTGSAIKIDFSGDDLRAVTDSAAAALGALFGKYGPGVVQPSPSNFNVFGPEIRVRPKLRELADVGMTPMELALAVQAAGDGAIVGEYRLGSDTIDLKVILAEAVDRRLLEGLEDVPVATPTGHVVPLSSVADFERTVAPPQINHVGRQRSVTLQFTPPPGLPLERAVDEIEALLAEMRADGRIAPGVATGYAGSASKLRAVQSALLGDGTLLGALESSLVLALATVYLLMCILFQSFLRPLVIMFSVPLATLGGFAALAVVHAWSVKDRYLPVQSMDVLTMLGFIILIGVVVNNAILIVHQSLNFMRGSEDAPAMEPRRAIAEAVKSRVRPIFMGTLTSVGGMAPLVLMPGSGSELYRGLGSVVVGGLLVSTVFTLLLVPMLFSLLTDAQVALRRVHEARRGAAAAVGAGATMSPDEK
ncbi:MAG: efflux RND transporter permease subunit [Phycisphaerales bacterium]|nr:efflux RND transporter permease subunit [Phycisphaerales bacterium]